MTAAQTPRRSDIDWLRIVASYLLLFFHTAMVFNPAPFYHIRNEDVSVVMMVIAGFISLWHMPLFFTLAGWSIVASVRKAVVVGRPERSRGARKVEWWK